MPFKLSPEAWKIADKVFLLSLAFISGVLLVYTLKPEQPETHLSSIASDKKTNVKKEDLSDAARIRLLIEDVPASDKYRYNATDDHGNGLDALKVIQIGNSDYLGIYHYRTNEHFTLKIASSNDLINWNFIADLDADSSMGDIIKLPEGDFLVAYEKSNGAESFINIRHYDNIDKLKSGAFSKEIALPRSLSQSNEGTPNFIKVEKKPFNIENNSQDWEGSKINLGFHYYTGTVDKNATGTLSDFTIWKTKNNSSINDYFGKIDYKGNYGDRDFFKYKNQKGLEKPFYLYEAQKTKNDWSAWKPFLIDMTTKAHIELSVFTHAGSISFGNPTVTALTLPDGSEGYFVSYYIFSEGSGSGEAGELIFYTQDKNLSKTTPYDKRPPAPTKAPAVTCTCNTPGGTVPNNGFICTDGESRYCAVNERCTEASSKPSYPCALIDAKSTTVQTPSAAPTPTIKSTGKPTSTPTRTPTPTTKTSSGQSQSATSTPTHAPASTNTPTPGISCTCTTPGGTIPNNGFTCADGYSSYCAENEYCTSSSTKPNWPCAASQQQPTATPTPDNSVTCTCTTPGGTVPNNGFTCSDGYSSYCAETEHCTTSSVKPAWPCASN